MIDKVNRIRHNEQTEAEERSDDISHDCGRFSDI